jgi:hypothetical protein
MSLQIKFQQIHDSNKTVSHFKETSTCIINNEDNFCRCLPNGFSREKQLMSLRIYLKEWKMLRQKSVHCLVLYNQI